MMLQNNPLKVELTLVLQSAAKAGPSKIYTFHPLMHILKSNRLWFHQKSNHTSLKCWDACE
jgi:hypothetical protein